MKPLTGLEGHCFNDGSCVHPRCITGIEIEQNQIILVKWSVRSQENRMLWIKGEIFEEPVPVSDCYHR